MKGMKLNDLKLRWLKFSRLKVEIVEIKQFENERTEIKQPEIFEDRRNEKETICKLDILKCVSSKTGILTMFYAVFALPT